MATQGKAAAYGLRVTLPAAELPERGVRDTQGCGHVCDKTAGWRAGEECRVCQFCPESGCDPGADAAEGRHPPLQMVKRATAPALRVLVGHVCSRCACGTLIYGTGTAPGGRVSTPPAAPVTRRHNLHQPSERPWERPVPRSPTVRSSLPWRRHTGKEAVTAPTKRQTRGAQFSSSTITQSTPKAQRP